MAKHKGHYRKSRRKWDYYDSPEAILFNACLYDDIIERRWFDQTQERLIIYPKDIQFMTGQLPPQVRRLIERIRKKFGKNKQQPVTIREFCKHTGLDELEIIEYTGRR